MTALAGLWRLDGRRDAADGCERMIAAQKIYGPHANAQWSSGDVALGRRLMRVLPEDRFDRQPLVGAGGKYLLVADVRIDNRDELIRTLAIPASRAAGLCDAAIVLAAIEHWGESCFEHLVGDYAFALWDGAERRLLLARDPIGQRPLHYHRSDKFFAFASMPKGLHALADVPYGPDEERIAEFLVLLPESGSQTFFQGIERVEPGHVVSITANGITSRRHWNPSKRQIVLPRPEDYSEALRDQLDQAVRCRLRGASEVGAFLSGGFDSSAVAATAARLLAPSGGKVIAFTAVPREGYAAAAPRNRVVDEGPYAAATAALYPNMEHLLIRDDGRSPLDDLDRIFALYERPALNICGGWMHSIYGAARQRRLPVLLHGLMGNSGLSETGMALLPELLRAGRWYQWSREAGAAMAVGMSWRGVLANTFGPWCPPALWVRLNRVFGRHGVDVPYYSAIHPQHIAELSARARAWRVDLTFRPPKNRFESVLANIRWIDLGNYNKGALGGWQIDLRDPTADVRLLEFCLAVPTEQYMSNGVQRALAKRALADRLPRMVLDEPRKGLQAADWHERLTAVRDRVVAEVDRLGNCPPAARAIDLPRLSRLAENWPSEGWERDEVTYPYRYALLRGISTGHFLRRVTGMNN